ncbi:MAG TPA: TonB-dependent receptor [Gemmatimonadaceae bacterium]|nr:TonB-dependent receptor [Gemmatimonadaceae bacterium]
MRSHILALAIVAAPHLLSAQQPAITDTSQRRQDSLRSDSLARRAQRLAPVTITASPARREEPSSAVTITPQVVQLTPAADPWDLVRQAGGVEVHEQGQGPGFASDASVRGFSSDHSTDMALWVDGVPINEPVNGHAEGYNDFSVIMIPAVQDADVIKGPTSALFGNFAFSGVMNLRTLDRMQGTEGWFTAGSYDRFEGTVLTGFDRDENSGVFGVRGMYDGGWRPHASYYLGQGHARYVHAFDSTTTIDGGVELYASNWDSPGFITTDQFARQDYDTVANMTDGGFKRRAQERVSLKVLTKSMLWRTTLYATQGRWQLYLTIPPEPGEGEGTGQQTEEEDSRFGFGLTSAATWSLPHTELTVGVEGRFDHAHYENWLTQDRVRETYQSLVTAHQLSGGLFVQSTEQLGSRLTLSLGARLDHVSTNSTPDTGEATTGSEGIFSPKLGALFKLTDALGVYANVSRGFRSPDGLVNDANIALITEWQYETGLKFDVGKLSASIAYFRMDVSNEESFDPITQETTSGGASRRQGIDFEVHTPIGSMVTFSTNWTYVDAKYLNLISDDGDTLSGTRVANTARWVGIAAVDVGPQGGSWTARISTNAVGPYTPFDVVGMEVPSYALLHLSGIWRIKRAQLELGIRNLLDKPYVELQASNSVSPGQPRTIYGDVKYVF